MIKYLPNVRQLEEVGLNFKTRSVCLSESKLCLKRNIALPDARHAREKVVKEDALVILSPVECRAFRSSPTQSFQGHAEFFVARIVFVCVLDPLKSEPFLFPHF